MNDSINNTQNALGAVAQWIAADRQVKVEWHDGGEVYADMDTKTLHIPSIAEADKIADDDLWLCRAHIYHEAGHIIETGKQKEDDNAGLHTVFNAIEDRRMERILRKRYDGAEIAFKKSLNHYNAEIKGRMEKKHPTPQFEALLGLSFESEGVTPAWEYSEEASEVADIIREDFMKVFDCRTSKECLKLAKVIWDKIKEQNEDKQEQQQGQDQNQNQNQNGEGEEDGENQNQNGEGDNQNPDDSESSENGQSGKSGEGDGEGDNQNGEGEGNEGEGDSQNANGNGSKGDNGEGEGQKSEVDGQKSKSGNPKTVEDSGESEETSGQKAGGKSLEDEMEESASAFGREAIEGEAVKKILNAAKLDGDPIYTSDRTRDTHLELESNAEGRRAYKEDLTECTGEAALLARTLEEYLKAVTKTKMLHCQRRGKLDPRRFTVLAKGLGKDVFKHLSNKRELDTAIEIIFDESGSMSEYHEVRKAIMIIAEALNRVGIPFEVTGGTTSGNMKYHTGLIRTNPILFRHYKTFGQGWESARGSLELSGAFNNYIDGEMVEFAAMRLVQRPEKRKIIFSLSDGCPCGGEGHDYELGRKLIRECEKCRKSGIEVYSFGIGTDEPSKYYGKQFSVRLDGYEIGKGLSTGISSVMTKGKIRE